MEKRINDVAYAVRERLEDEEIKSMYIGFRSFPSGSCMDASILLGLILEQKGLGVCNYVSSGNEPPSHSWLEVNGVIIDITADQFSSSNPKVLIIQEYSKELTHLGFSVFSRQPVKSSIVPDSGFYQALTRIMADTTHL